MSFKSISLMKKLYVIIIAALLAVPMNMNAQGFAQLWKQATTAQQKDLPAQELKALRQIEHKAQQEKSYGNLLKAKLRTVQVQAAVSPDSLLPEMDRLQTAALQAESEDPVLAAVYEAVLGCIFKEEPSLLPQPLEVRPAVKSADKKSSGQQAGRRDAAWWFDKALEKSDLLVKIRDNSMDPLVVTGTDSRIFMHDLLHIVGFEAEAYKMLHDIYKARGNRSAACITGFLYTRQQRKDFSHEVRKSKYVQTLDSLITEYGDLVEAGEVAIARYHDMEEAEDATVEDRYNYVNYALNRWGAWPRMNILRNAQTRLTLPSFHVMLGDPVLIPHTPRTIEVLGVTNVSQLTMTLQRVKVDGNTELNPAYNEDYQKLKKLIDTSFTPYSQTRRYIGLPDYATSRDTLQLPALDKGVYLVEFTTNNNNIKTERSLLFVSDVMVIHQTLSERNIRLVAVNATTGQPISGCKIDINTFERYGKPAVNKTVECDKNGEVIYNYDVHPDEIYAYTSQDRSSRRTAFRGYFSYHDNNSSSSLATIFTDRRLYRPGQTVHVAVVTYQNREYEDLAIEPNKNLHLVLRDANGKNVGEQSVTTDEFGMASVEFQLPTSGLTGHFTIRSDYGNRATAYIQVEEYKRPTFEIVFDDINEQYTSGDTVIVRGTARSYAGVPVQDAQVAYAVTRRPSLWWWYRSLRDTEKILKTDTIRTDADGRFAVPVLLEMPENYDSHRPRYYSFDVNATVTDLAGESHEGMKSLPLSDKPTVLTCNLPEKALRDSLTRVRFNYLNNAGQPIPGEVRFTINGGKTFTGKANEPIKLPAFAHSGRYTIHAVCGTDSLEQSVVLFSLADKRPVIETHDWFYASDNVFPRDGKPVYVQVGSSDKDQHIVYTVLSGNNVIESGVIDQSNSLNTRQFRYKDSYGDGILLSYAWVKGGKTYTHTTSIAKPLPDKRLLMEWTTFRDRLTPGQKEEWSLHIKRPDGKPAEAQLLVTMYDKSLDQILAHSWSFLPNLYRSLPSSSWYGPAYGAVGLYGEQPMKPLYEKNLDWSHFDSQLYPRYPMPMLVYEVAAGTRLMKSAAVPQMARANSMDAADAAMEDEAAEEKAVVTADNVVGNDGGEPQEAEVQVRENLNETAFFYPALKSDADGNVTISFTLPESITTWRLMGFAHDKEMNYGDVTSETVAQKTVMIQPNMPRFLRVGDKATVAARLFNTSEETVTGTARLQIINPANDKVIIDKKQTFTIDASGSSAVAFDGITLAQTDVYICKVTAAGTGYSDGEQHYLPVLPEKQLVTNTLPFTQNEAGTKTVDLTKLFPVNEVSNKLTVEYTNNPAWLMIQALPTVSNAWEKDAISLATAYYANSISNSILHQTPAIKKTIELWKQEKGDETSLMSSLQKNEDLKNLVLNETPWVAEAERETDQKARLINFFDQNLVDYRLNTQLEHLKKLQNSDGSFSWWPGMEGSIYVTTQVVETMARLEKMLGSQPQVSRIIENGLDYLSECIHEEVVELKKHEKERQKHLRPSEMAVCYLYIRALRGDELSGGEKADEAYLVSLLEKKTTELSIYGKARSAQILAHNDKSSRAKDMLQSIREYTVYKEEMGRYFDTPRALYTWRNYRIPSQVAAIEALQALAPTDKAIQEMQRWLLQSKRTQAWDTPVNTVDAVYAFLGGQEKVLSELTQSNQARLSVNGKRLELPQATAGLGYVKTALTGNNMKTFAAEKTSEGTSWGALYAQFFQPVTDVADASAGITVKREIITPDGYLYDASQSEPLSVGDCVKVRLTITADRDYDFVQVVDQRAACMEPLRQLSGYRGGYYTAPRDNATNYYFDCFRKGTHVIESEYYIDRNGDYETGLCTVQCAYSPEFSARTKAQKIKVGK